MILLIVVARFENTQTFLYTLIERERERERDAPAGKRIDMACFISSTTSFCYATPIRAPSASSSASDGFRFGFRIKINSRPFPSSSKRTFRPQHVYDPYRKIDLPSLEEFYNDEGKILYFHLKRSCSHKFVISVCFIGDVNAQICGRWHDCLWEVNLHFNVVELRFSMSMSQTLRC